MTTLGHKRRRKDRVELGLAISALTLPLGATRTYHDIAAYCDCTWQNIYNIEQRAIRKLQAALKVEPLSQR